MSSMSKFYLFPFFQLKKKIEGVVLLGKQDGKDVSALPTSVDEVLKFKREKRKTRYILTDGGKFIVFIYQ